MVWSVPSSPLRIGHRKRHRPAHRCRQPAREHSTGRVAHPRQCAARGRRLQPQRHVGHAAGRDGQLPVLVLAGREPPRLDDPAARHVEQGIPHRRVARQGRGREAQVEIHRERALAAMRRRRPRERGRERNARHRRGRVLRQPAGGCRSRPRSPRRRTGPAAGSLCRRARSGGSSRPRRCCCVESCAAPSPRPHPSPRAGRPRPSGSSSPRAPR